MTDHPDFTKTLPCTYCEGSKVNKYDPTRACYKCEGRGDFPGVDIQEIVDTIRATQGKNRGRLRASMVSPLRSAGPQANRAYYCWRMARFHGGKDMTMPMTASMLIDGDPYRAVLDKLADLVAKETFGTDLAAATVWGRVLWGVLYPSVEHHRRNHAGYKNRNIRNRS